ncbi:hypothetical protein SAMN05216262_13118 [Colwellia chukchiensis]|uniref:Uncharacterized protein n=1 Tax=Colwellia chukchiensis TaxID=641665 RepID=A0A1H7TZF3_9GAMM|nr:hypothetical protein [Colwellia chukchiensis]SEL90220.1 hypothetical protein SAMN05216262_13118 [Colwellia chukchiensis]
MMEKEILNIFESKADEAFDEMFDSLQALLRPHLSIMKLTFDNGKLRLTAEDELNPVCIDVYSAFKQIVGRCGALVGAAGKTAQRTVIINELVLAKNDGVDITPAVANNVCKSLLGRGCSKKVLAEHFSQKNRTAADKSLCFSDKKQKERLEKVTTGLDDQVKTLKGAIRIIRLNKSLNFVSRWSGDISLRSDK